MRVHVYVVLWACWAKVALMDSNENIGVLVSFILWQKVKRN